MKVSRSEHAVLEQGREVIQKELEEETNERLRKIKRSILEPLQGSASFLSMGNMERRKKYASMTAAEVVLEVFTNAEGVFAPRMARVGAPNLRFASPASATETVALSFHSRLQEAALILLNLPWKNKQTSDR